MRGRVEGVGPTTAAELAGTSTLAIATIEKALLALEAEGFVMRGLFTPHAAGISGTVEPVVEWCERRLLASIHRYTVNRMRAEIEPRRLT